MRKVRIIMWTVFIGMLVFTMCGCGAVNGLGRFMAGVGDDLSNASEWTQHGLDNGFNHGGNYSRRNNGLR